MSARKWREQQQRRQAIIEQDVIYVDNMRAAIQAKHEGRITPERFNTVLHWNQQAAMRRHGLAMKARVNA